MKLLIDDHGCAWLFLYSFLERFDAMISCGCCHSACYYSSRRCEFVWGVNLPNSCLLQCLDKYSSKGSSLGFLTAILRVLRLLIDGPGYACFWYRLGRVLGKHGCYIGLRGRRAGADS